VSIDHRFHTTTETTGASNERKCIAPSASGLPPPSVREHLDPAARSEGTMRFKIARALVIALAGAGAFVGVAVVFGSSAGAQSGSCVGAVTGAPSGPAAVSATSTSFGRALVVGSGPDAGCSLYLLTSDELHGVTGAPFACSDNPNVRGKPCDTVLWPAVLTDGAPIAGPGVDPRLLGTVTRADLALPGAPAVEQVTYAGWPLYRFFRDETPGETEGANLNDPVTTPPGIWYLVNPHGGVPATGPAELDLETAPLHGTGPEETVLAARMNNDFGQIPQRHLPRLHPDPGRPVGRLRKPRAGPRHRVPGAVRGVLAAGPHHRAAASRPRRRPARHRDHPQPDGTRQVTYHGRPLYLYNQDAYIAGANPVGTPGINGAGALTPSGVFNTIPPPSPRTPLVPTHPSPGRPRSTGASPPTMGEPTPAAEATGGDPRAK
jgi:hypothetical protein